MTEVLKKQRKGGRSARLANRPEAHPLVEKGAPNYTKSPSMGQVCVIACGALAHEILDVVKVNGLDHISLTCLPAKLHNEPEKITGQVKRAIDDARKAGFEHIFCGYGDCGTGGALDRLLDKENVSRLPGAHCYAFFTGVEEFDARDEMRSFYLTDFLARHFDGLTWGPLGLNDHPELVKDYFGNYESVVFLSQTENPEYLERAQEIATRLGLRFEHRRTGYGDLATSLNDLSG